jgi:hypothetical protein
MFNDSLLVAAALRAAQLALHRLTQVSCVGGPHVSAVRCSRVLAGALLSLHLGLIKQLLAMLHC